MTFVSFAQNFEDVLLWRALKHIEKGRYLDIGAQDPIRDSVSLVFYEKGWRGVHVEPTSTYAAQLRDSRPDETVIEAAVTDAQGPIEFYEFPDTGLSTGKSGIAERHSRSGFQKRKVIVPTVRLDNLLETETGDFHWMKIDVEGMEDEVLRSWGKSDRRPWIVVIEAILPNSEERTEQLYIEEVFDRGYREVYFDGLNRYYLHEAHEELAKHFESSPNLFDDFGVSDRHFSTRAIVNSHLAQLNDERAKVAAAAAELAGAREFASSLEAELAGARDREAAARERIVTAERDHREHIERLWQDRAGAEDEIRRAAGELEQSLRDKLKRALSYVEENQAELSRLKDQAAQLEEQLRQSDDKAHETAEQLRQSDDKAHETAEQLRRERERAAGLQHQLEAHWTAGAERDRLVYAVLSERPGRWQRLGRALGLATPSPAIAALANWSARAPNPPPAEPEQSSSARDTDSEQGYPEVHLTNPYLRANSLPELLEWEDVDFVRCAYVTILGRQPDPIGEASYTALLRGGSSKMEILWELRRSQEGRTLDPGIAGLDLAQAELATLFASAAAGELPTDNAAVVEQSSLSSGALPKLSSDFPSLLLTYVRESRKE